MSWDLIILDYPKEAVTIKDVPEGWTAKPFGTRREIIRKIKEVVPNADFSGPSCGYIDGEGYSIEIWMTTDDDENVDPSTAASNRKEGWMESDVDEDQIMVSVRGNNTAAFVVADILRHLGLRAYDTWKEDFFEPDHPLPGLQQWQGFVAKVHKNLQDSDK